MSKIDVRLRKIERQLSEVRLTRCPLCLDGGVWRIASWASRSSSK
jgi:hypothetical protein